VEKKATKDFSSFINPYCGNELIQRFDSRMPKVIRALELGRAFFQMNAFYTCSHVLLKRIYRSHPNNFLLSVRLGDMHPFISDRGEEIDLAER
jgi:hypothetical protein